MLPSEHLVDYDAEGPHVDTFAIPLALSLLGSHKQDGAHDLSDVILPVEDIGVHFGWKAKVCNLCRISFLRIIRKSAIMVKIFGDQYIFWLQIPMNEILLMDLTEATANILGDWDGYIFVHNQRILFFIQHGTAIWRFILGGSWVDRSSYLTIISLGFLLPLLNKCFQSATVDLLHFDEDMCLGVQYPLKDNDILVL